MIACELKDRQGLYPTGHPRRVPGREREDVQYGREALVGGQEPPDFACRRPEFLGPTRPLCSWLPLPPTAPPKLF